MKAARRQSGFTVLELMLAIGIAAMLIAAVTGMFVRGSRTSEITTDSASINTINTAFREFILSDLRVASRAQSQPHTDEAACAYFAKPSAWVSYCNAGDGVHRAEVPRTATPPAQLATDEPLHPHGAPTAGGASSSRLVGPGATLAITTSGAAYEAVLEVPHPDPVVPPSRTTIRVTPRVGG